MTKKVKTRMSVKFLNEFRESFKSISRKFLTNFANFAKMNYNFRFRSHFRWMNKILAKKIKRKFGNLNPAVSIFVGSVGNKQTPRQANFT